MLTRLRIVRLVAVLGLASASILISACDGSVAPSEQEPSSSIASVAQECTNATQHLAEITLTHQQIVTTLEYAFNPALPLSVTSTIDENLIFDGETIANLGEGWSQYNSDLVLRKLAAAFIDFRRSEEFPRNEEGYYCDLAVEACAYEFLAHFTQAFSLHPLSENQLQTLTTQFMSAPVDTLVEVIDGKFPQIDLTELSPSEVAAIRLSLLLQHRMPGYDYQRWAEDYSLDHPDERVALAENLLRWRERGFKKSIKDFFSRYLRISDSDMFQDETLQTLYLQVVGANSPTFKGTLADIFNSKMALVSDEFASAYRDEGAVDYGQYSGAGAYTLFEVEGRPGVFSQVAALKNHRLTGYGYEYAFNCRNAPYTDHFGSDWDPIFDDIDQEQIAQGFDYPQTYYLERLVELGEGRANGGSCKGCHMPSLLIEHALSAFDENGMPRSEFDLGNGITLPIDTSGQFFSSLGGTGRELVTYDDLTDFLSQVVETKMAKQCFVEKWVERSLQVSDEFNCESPTLEQAFDASGGHIRTLILDIIASDLFTSNGQTN